MKWLRRLFWHKTVDELMAELNSGKRLRISADEIELARKYTRSLLPADLRFPHEGEVYEAIDDFSISYMTSHYAPFTGGGRALLPKGERVRVSSASHARPICVYCEPLRYEELHEVIVPDDERSVETYSGYYFSIDTEDLNRFFRLVDVADAAGGKDTQE